MGSVKPKILVMMNPIILINIFFLFSFAIFQDITTPVQEFNYHEQRMEMVNKQIVNRGISDPEVIAAMKSVERHEFVPADKAKYAYQDSPLPIGMGQTISQPYIVALMTDLLDLKANEKILEVGTGSGYQAAVLAEICKNVYSIEVIPELAARAKKTLQKLNYHNVHLRTGDGYKGWKEAAPFDAIIVTAAPTHIPEPLKAQLAENGRMVIPVGGKYTQELVLIEKKNGKLRKKDVIPVRFVPMIDDEGEKY